MDNNLIRNMDFLGDTVILNNRGDVISNDKVGTGVYVHHFKEGTNSYIGEIGGKIDANEIYGNLLGANIKEAKGIVNPSTFRNKVKNKGEWDYKNQKGSIFGLANDGKTKFSFEGKEMKSQDIGNHHFGAVAKAALGGLLTETEMLERAGEAQIKAGTSQPEWQIKVEVLKIVPDDGLGPTSYQKVQKLLPLYGDDPRDQNWIKAGFEYFKKHNK